MSWTFLNSAIGSGATNPVTTAMDTSGADLLVVHLCYLNAPSSFVSNPVNSFTGLTAEDGGVPIGRIFYFINPVTSTTQTFTANGTNIFCSIIALAFSASGAARFSVEANDSGSGTTQQPGSITPAENGALLVCGHGVGTDQTHTVTSPFTETDEVTFSAGVTEGSSFAYLIQEEAAAVNPTWTGAGSVEHTANMALFIDSSSVLMGPHLSTHVSTNFPPWSHPAA